MRQSRRSAGPGSGAVELGSRAARAVEDELRRQVEIVAGQVRTPALVVRDPRPAAHRADQEEREPQHRSQATAAGASRGGPNGPVDGREAPIGRSRLGTMRTSTFGRIGATLMTLYALGWIALGVYVVAGAAAVGAALF